jgi:hypothetical protein
MQTVISSFATRHAARRAIDRLVEIGIRRDDIHLEHGMAAAEADAPPMDKATWDGMEREIAMDRNVLESVGHFFSSLFGQDNPSGQVASYSQAVEQGGCVLVLEAPDREIAQRAQSILHELGGLDPHTLERGMHQRPLRDIVAGRRDEGGQLDRSRSGSSEPRAVRSEQGERAFAFGGERQRSLDLRERDQRERDQDLTHAPGLRYADKDKPGR